MTPTDFLRLYETSTAKGGVELTLGLIADEAVYWFSDGSVHVGKPAIERVLRRNHDLILNETYRISDVVWLAETDDVAACTYRFDWSGQIHGTPASGSGRGTCVLARKSGQWKVVHEHLSKGNATP